MLSSFQGMQDSVKRLVSENATVILTAGGVVGTVATGILAWRGGYTTAEKIWAQQTVMVSEAEAQNAIQGTPDKELPVLDLQTKLKLGALQAIPPIIVGGGTITAIIFSHRMSAQKAATMAALYGLSQNQFEEYKAKVQEKLTGPKAQAIDDELAQDRVNNTAGASQVIVVEGKVLCFDSPTGRYFQSSMEDIKKAEISTNQEILHHDIASASFFYEQLGLPPTTWSEDVGWNSDNIVDIEYSTVLAYNDQPCLAINFKYLPRPDYTRRY